MSILVDQTGKVYNNLDAINKLLSPVLMGKFDVSDDAQSFLANNLSDHNTEQLFEFIPSDMLAFCQEKGLIPTKASVLSQEQSRSKASQTPHINAGDEIHFFYDGSYKIYFNIRDHHFCVIVQAGDWMYIPKDVEHWIKETEDNYLVIVSFHCEPFEIFHTKVAYTDTKSKAYL